MQRQLQPQHIPTLKFRLVELNSRLGDDPQYTSIRQTIASYLRELRMLMPMIPKNHTHLFPDDPLALRIDAFMRLPECVYAMRNPPGDQVLESPPFETAPPAHDTLPSYVSETHLDFTDFSRATFASGNNYNATMDASTGSGSNTAQGYNNSPGVPQGVPSGATYTRWNGYNGWMAPDMGTFFVVEAGNGRLYSCAVGGTDIVWNRVN